MQKQRYKREEFALTHLIIPEQGLPWQPDFILLHSFPRKQQQQQHSGHHQRGGPTAVQPRAELVQSMHNKDAVAHAGKQGVEAGLFWGVPYRSPEPSISHS